MIERVGRGFSTSKGREVIYDAEHFFDGYKNDSDYALATLAPRPSRTPTAWSSAIRTAGRCPTNCAASFAQ